MIWKVGVFIEVEDERDYMSVKYICKRKFYYVRSVILDRIVKRMYICVYN